MPITFGHAMTMTWTTVHVNRSGRIFLRVASSSLPGTLPNPCLEPAAAAVPPFCFVALGRVSALLEADQLRLAGPRLYQQVSPTTRVLVVTIRRTVVILTWGSVRAAGVAEWPGGILRVSRVSTPTGRPTGNGMIASTAELSSRSLVLASNACVIRCSVIELLRSPAYGSTPAECYIRAPRCVSGCQWRLSRAWLPMASINHPARGHHGDAALAANASKAVS
jgi:hypothetical protein